MSRLLIAVLVVLLSSASSLAQAPTRIASGYSAISGPHAVLWTAREAGLFEKNGLRAEVAYIRSGTLIPVADQNIFRTVRKVQRRGARRSASGGVLF